eukprot:scaffold12390_cov80-Skeletonema_marinoi.AAC.1
MMGDRTTASFKVYVRKIYMRTGTTDTYFIKSISDEFRKYWYDMTGIEYSNDPIQASAIDIRALPTIILQMSPHE